MMRTVHSSGHHGGWDVYPSVNWAGGVYPSMHLAGGVSFQGVSAWGVSARGGSAQGVSAQGVSAPCMLGCTLPPMDRMTDACENIKGKVRNQFNMRWTIDQFPTDYVLCLVVIIDKIGSIIASVATKPQSVEGDILIKIL